EQRGCSEHTAEVAADHGAVETFGPIQIAQVDRGRLVSGNVGQVGEPAAHFEQVAAADVVEAPVVAAVGDAGVQQALRFRKWQRPQYQPVDHDQHEDDTGESRREHAGDQHGKSQVARK